jgi:hypothetical protein
MEEEIKKTEDEIITFEELKNKHPNVSMENLSKMVLICKNCGHKDLLINFLKKIENPIFSGMTPYNPQRRNPSPYKTPDRFGSPYFKKYTAKAGKGMGIAIVDEVSKIYTYNVMKEGFEEYFHCPKCKSSLITLSSEYAKNNIVRVL